MKEVIEELRNKVNIKKAVIQIIVLIAILMLKTLFFYYNVGLDKHDGDKPNLISFLFILLFTCPFFFIKKDKNLFRAIIIYDILFSTLLFVDNLYWTYSANMLSVSQIFYVKYAEEIGAALPTLLKFSHILYFIDIPVLLGARYLIKRFAQKENIEKTEERSLPIAFIYALLIIIIAPKTIVGAVETMSNVPYLKTRQVAIGSVYGYHFLDAYNAMNIKDTTKYNNYDDMLTDYLELKEYKDEKFEKEDIFGIAENKNVIIVQLESIQNFVVGREINGKEITPNLNKFLAENVEISNMIIQSYSTTADSEYSVISSLYPLDNGQAFSRIFCKYK